MHMPAHLPTHSSLVRRLLSALLSAPPRSTLPQHNPSLPPPWRPILRRPTASGAGARTTRRARRTGRPAPARTTLPRLPPPRPAPPRTTTPPPAPALAPALAPAPAPSGAGPTGAWGLDRERNRQRRGASMQRRRRARRLMGRDRRRAGHLPRRLLPLRLWPGEEETGHVLSATCPYPPTLGVTRAIFSRCADRSLTTLSFSSLLSLPPSFSFLVGSSDSDSDDGRRVVRSAKDKALEELRGACDEIQVRRREKEGGGRAPRRRRAPAADPSPSLLAARATSLTLISPSLLLVPPHNRTR